MNWGYGEIGFVWVCFLGPEGVVWFRKPLLYRSLQTFGPFGNWVCFGFVFSPPEGGFIVICLCIINIYVHFGLSEIGFVLHKKG